MTMRTSLDLRVGSESDSYKVGVSKAGFTKQNLLCLVEGLALKMGTQRILLFSPRNSLPSAQGKCSWRMAWIKKQGSKRPILRSWLYAWIKKKRRIKSVSLWGSRSFHISKNSSVKPTSFDHQKSDCAIGREESTQQHEGHMTSKVSQSYGRSYRSCHAIFYPTNNFTSKGYVPASLPLRHGLNIVYQELKHHDLNFILTLKRISKNTGQSWYFLIDLLGETLGRRRVVSRQQLWWNPHFVLFCAFVK